MSGTFERGQVVSVSRGVAGGALQSDAPVAATELVFENAYDFDESGGVADVDGTLLTYDSVDFNTNTMTLSAPLDVSLVADTFIAVHPIAPVHTAWVLRASDTGAQATPARIPHHLRALLAEGERQPAQRESIVVVYDGDEYVVFDVVFRPGQHDASTVPIVVSNVEGEGATHDADGFSTYTNDPVPVWTSAGLRSAVAATATHLAAVNPVSGDLEIYTLTATGFVLASSTPGPFIAGSVAIDSTYAWAIDGSADICRVTIVGGATSTISGTFVQLAADDTHVYATDASGDIRKFDGGSLAEVVVGFPIALAAECVTTNGTHLAARVTASGDIHLYLCADGTEVTDGWPVSLGTASAPLALDDTRLYAVDSTTGDIHAYLIGDGGEITEQGFPIEGPFAFVAAVSSDGIYVVRGTPTGPIRKLNNAENYQSTNINSSDGTARFHSVGVSDLVIYGDVVLGGQQITTAWADYAPVWSAATVNPDIGDGTIIGKYQRVGNTVHFRIEVVAGSTTTYGSGSYLLTLPFPLASTQRLLFAGTLRDASASGTYMVVATRNAASQVVLQTAGAPLVGVSATAPFTFAQSDAIVLAGTYETT